MYTIKTLNAISPVGLAKLPANQFEIDNEAAAPQGILVRSADMHEAPLPDSLLAIARLRALLSLTRRVPTPTRWRSSSSVRWWRAAAIWWTP